MNNEEFDQLKLRMQIVPTAERWRDDLLHWQAMKTAALEARGWVSKASAAMDGVDQDANLSPEGKANQCRQIAERAIADLQASKSLEHARTAVGRMEQQWQQKLGSMIKPAATPHEASVHSEIRARVSDMKQGRVAFLEKHAADPVIASALLTTPAFLSGLSDAEVALIKRKIETAVSPEIVEARAETAKALAEVEQGWARAINVVAQRGGLEKKAAAA